MGTALAIFVWLSFLGGMCISAGWVASLRLAAEANRRATFRWLIGWSIKGLLVPLTLWAVMNFGVSFDFPAFMPKIQQAQNLGRSWFPDYLRYFAHGMFITGSYWLALTLAWALARLAPTLAEQPRAKFQSLAWIAFLGLILPALGLVYVAGLPVLGFAVSIVLLPIAGYAPEVIRPPIRSPLYARAIAKIKFGKYAEAEWEIISELEKCQDDFDGWMMMAELYANHFHDLGEAEQTILDICDQPKVTPSQISIALHKLAEWHLSMADDPDAARRCLQMIRDRCPGSHLARMAQLRMNQLPHSAQELRDQRGAKPIPLPALGERFDETPPPPDAGIERHKAAESAKDCVRMLEKDPDYVPAREKLARLLAEHLGQPEPAIEQLTLLLEMNGQPEAQRAEWLSLMAAWHFKYRHDLATGFRLLERVTREFPNTPQALAALHRLRLRDQEEKAKTAPPPRKPIGKLA